MLPLSPADRLAMHNLFAQIPPARPEEQFESLLAFGGLRIERIVSHGHASPPGFWYDQPQHEWVALLQGAARLRIANEEKPRELRPGDWVNLPAHCRHRVEWTTPEEPTVWLAVHYGEATADDVPTMSQNEPSARPSA